MALCSNAKDQTSSVSICSSEGCQIRTFTANEAMRAESVIGYAPSASGSAFASMRLGATHRIKSASPSSISAVHNAHSERLELLGGRAATEPGGFRDYNFLSHT